MGRSLFAVCTLGCVLNLSASGCASRGPTPHALATTPPERGGGPGEVPAAAVASAPSPARNDGADAGIDQATAQHVRALVQQGRARGNRHDVLAKVGDSITETQSFLYDCGMGWYALGAHAALEPTVRYFSQRALADGANSLTRQSTAATAGWSVSDATDGGESSPLARELDALRPQWALVLFGTNDLERVEPAVFRANMARALDLIESRGAVAVLSTIPPRGDGEPFASRVAAFNDAVRGLSRERHLPLVDLWSALRELPHQGASEDGVHPSIYHSDACVFTPDALRYGYNVRNLATLEMLARLRQL
jgi:lysophospholipase L1-like esterase